MANKPSAGFAVSSAALANGLAMDDYGRTMIAIDEARDLAESPAAVCSVFANPKRILILWTLVEHEKSVGEIASSVGMSMQCTSQHLRLMKEQGILESRREGHTIYYFVARNEVTATCQLLIHLKFWEFKNSN